MSGVREGVSYSRAVALMTGTAFLVPLVGLVTAPILARGLDTIGRGELAASMAPAGIMAAFATLGLPDALTFVLAREPGHLKRALALSSVCAGVLAALCIGAVAVSSNALSGGRASLQSLILLASLLLLPQLFWNMFRGAAIGLQRWGLIVFERVTTAILRVAIMLTLWLTGSLTVLTALLATMLIPAISGLIYLALLVGRGHVVEDGDRTRLFLPMVSFGVQVWAGSIAGMLLSRVGQLLLVPLVGPSALGLYAVAVTASDLLLIAVSAVESTLFGVNSRTQSLPQVTFTSRATLVAAFSGATLYSCTLPVLIPLVFGPSFAGAVLPSILLTFASACATVGTIAGTSLGSRGKPILRSAVIAVVLVLNVLLYLLVVPSLGVVGACLAQVVSSAVLSLMMAAVAARALGTRISGFFLVTTSDLESYRDAVGRALRLVLGGLQRMRRPGH